MDHKICSTYNFSSVTNGNYHYSMIQNSKLFVEPNERIASAVGTLK